ncbi:TIGR03088 family PEP-CTERM/XrtA system glycosyltransferase [Accumulibacter sp.]|uniref:TIGR03088 family PEP-CTERM/XrtA system glycosyltransferase n=1 Tax=Accumulibacter sp. TaxID=2053492 RepID=UPI00261B792D|nr:TIGR03088 family PEP-CTERM/XrtA system glycosyltransferase [Accumulibacter sp.]HRD92090.1 TIGR03088 family PEP-CTERM/XrtA system glycosyltransferase [Accumulibacter sp.]
MMPVDDARLLVAHVVFRFDVGGLENGVVNLINHMPRDAYRHVVISLTEITDFRKRIVRDDVGFIALKKKPGHTLWLYPRLFGLFRELRPAIVHSRNLAALEVAVPAWAAGVPVRIHGEHGRDVGDLDGSNKKYQWLRRLYSPFVTRYIALSRDLADYLTGRVGISPARVEQIYNGVDIRLFHPARPRPPIAGCPFPDPGCWLVGTVGRMQVVKDQTTLAAAFVRALAAFPELASRLRLVMIGDGPLRAKAQALLDDAGVAELAWLPGQRDDVPDILRGLDCFVLPSLAEGISNTILEAMASGLPVIATDVGGNGELLEAGRTGELVPAADVEAMAQQIAAHALDADRSRAAGEAGRALVERRFSMEAMRERHQALYDELLDARTGKADRTALLHR